MTDEQEKLLNEIHELALSNDHLVVPYNHDNLTMANAVIKKANQKLMQIADMIQVVCDD